MKQSKPSTRSNVVEVDVMEHGRAIARAMDEHKVQKEKNMAKAEKRKISMLHRAADIEIGRNYS